MFLPIQRGARLGELVVAVARARNAKRDIGGMRRNFIRDASLLHIVLLWQTQMFLGSDVTQHARAVVRGAGGANATCDVVVARKNIRDQRPKHIERRAVAKSSLQFHVVFNLIQRNVTGSLHHHLHALSPRALGEFTNRRKLSKLRRISRVGKTAGTQAIANGKCHVIAAHDGANTLPTFVHHILSVVNQHPLGQQTSAAAHDANQTILDQRQVLLQNARVNGEVINALLGLMFKRFQNHSLV